MVVSWDPTHRRLRTPFRVLLRVEGLLLASRLPLNFPKLSNTSNIIFRNDTWTYCIIISDFLCAVLVSNVFALISNLLYYALAIRVILS